MARKASVCPISQMISCCCREVERSTDPSELHQEPNSHNIQLMPFCIAKPRGLANLFFFLTPELYRKICGLDYSYPCYGPQVLMLCVFPLNLHPCSMYSHLQKFCHPSRVQVNTPGYLVISLRIHESYCSHKCIRKCYDYLLIIILILF